MMAIVPDLKNKKFASITGKCSSLTEQVQLQLDMAVVPEPKTTIQSQQSLANMPE